MTTDTTRIDLLNDQQFELKGSCVIYWMQKDQRPRDNWALQHAAELANEHNVPLVVAFFVWELTFNAYVRHYDFMLKGLAETARELREQGIGFVMRHQVPPVGIVKLAKELSAVAVVTDQSYLALGRKRRQRAAEALPVRLEAVHANTIVPPSVVADKALFAAYHFRPKVQRMFDRYLTDYPPLKVDKGWSATLTGLDDQAPDVIVAGLKLDASVGPSKRTPGTAAAHQILVQFADTGIGQYHSSRNDPVAQSTSQLSAYLHYGQISSQRVAFELLNSPHYGQNREAVDGYLDELITWRELSINFCSHHDDYTQFSAIPEWAQTSLNQHAYDERETVYTLQQLEDGQTHDELWNAAQLEMVRAGRMHGYMRMYWAKKILEWTENPEQALEYTVYLNDKYELDGRDPNGYTGILWSIGGLHDRPWFERPIFGKIRYMSYGGAKGKFNIKSYVDYVESLC